MDAADKSNTLTSVEGDATPSMSSESTYTPADDTGGKFSNEVSTKLTLYSTATGGLLAGTSESVKDLHEKFTLFSKLPI